MKTKEYPFLRKKRIKEFLFIISVFLIAVFINLILREDITDFPLLRSIIAAVLFGSVTSFFELHIAEKIAPHTSYRKYFFHSFSYYYVSFILILMLMGYSSLIIKNGYSIKQALSTHVLEIYPNGFKEILLNLFLLVATITYIRLTNKFIGQGVIKNYFLGKYHEPKIEERIFLFLDLKSSSRIAEVLGPAKYSNFLKDFFKELDEPILATNAQLYQYVGDEIVLLWSLEKGVQNNNCINFYFRLVNRIKNQTSYFKEKYGFVPEFKTAIHYGKVSVSEIGSLKKEIAYHGDPINTTSRLLQKCKEINENFLVSAELVSLLKDLDSHYSVRPLGVFELKGKKNVIGIFSVNPMI